MYQNFIIPYLYKASYKYGIIKFRYIVAYCWIFLYELYYDARIHEHQVEKRLLDQMKHCRLFKKISAPWCCYQFFVQ